jgi:RimJ/RimL family protein N-acetyltransferase
MDAPELETERLLLRQWRDEDVAELDRIYADPQVWRFLGGALGAAPHTREQVDRFRRHWDEHGYGMEKCGLTLRGLAPWHGLDHVWYAIDREDRRGG